MDTADAPPFILVRQPADRCQRIPAVLYCVTRILSAAVYMLGLNPKTLKNQKKTKNAKLELEDLDVVIDEKTLISFLLAGLRTEYDQIVLSVRTSPPKKVDTFDKVFNHFNGVVPYLEEKLKKLA